MKSAKVMDECFFFVRVFRIFSAHGQCLALRIWSLSSALAVGVLPLYECDSVSASCHVIVISFSLGQPCFERNVFTDSENCNYSMFIMSVSCFYWSTHAQYIIT